MRSSVASLALVLVTALVAGGPAAAVDPIELDPGNYKETVESEDTALVYFSASYCNDCPELRRVISEATDILAAKGLRVPAYFVDMEKHEAIKELAGVRGVPTLSLVRKGVRSNYRGMRQNAGQVAHYLEVISGPTLRRLTSLADARSWETNPNTLHAVVGAFDASEAGSQRRAALRNLADKLREDFVFFEVPLAEAEPALLSHYGLAAAGAGQLAVYRSWEPSKPALLPAADAWTAESLEKFVRANSFPDFPIIGKKWMKFVVATEKTIVRVIIDAESDDDISFRPLSDQVKQQMEVARQTRAIVDATPTGSELVWVWAPHATHLYMMEPMGYANVKPALLINKFGDPNKFVFRYEWTKDHLATWIDDWKNKRIRPWVKSEKEPEVATVNGVTTLVGSTLWETAMDPNKDVLVEFYAPWCGHCKKLAPIWDELGKKFEGVDQVVIAKIDGTANEWDKEKFPLTGYPTIYFVPAGRRNGTPLKYTYARDLDTFVKYLDQMKGGTWSLADTEVKKEKKEKKKKDAL